MDVTNNIEKLKDYLAGMHDLEHTLQVLHWDQATYMPPGGEVARAQQIATLTKLHQDAWKQPHLGELLDTLDTQKEMLEPDSDAACLIARTRQTFERLAKVPVAFSTEFETHKSQTFNAWMRARPNNDFASVAPMLEKILNYSRELAHYLGYQDHLADPLINLHDEGMTVSQIRPLFAELREALKPMVKATLEHEPLNQAVLKQPYPQEQQLAISYAFAKELGFDGNRGRQDLSHHPFCTSFDIADVRITTRVDPYNLEDCLFSVLHETGHALYEQGVNPALRRTLLASGVSSGVHESQSRLWENLVGRSRGFWHWAFPKLRDAFPDQLTGYTEEDMYHAINYARPGYIRTEADELSYNLHIILRFELECELLEGTLAVRDLPEAWRARYEEYLGLMPPNDTLGCLQDVHWYADAIGGAFQGYTLGNILSAQFFNAAQAAHPSIPHEIERGEFETLHTWLKDTIYTHGSKFTPTEIISRATGGPMKLQPYLDYLSQKYGVLYHF